MKEVRQKMLADLQIVVKKPRFGLFSQPPPIAVGDNSYFHSKSGTPASTPAHKGKDGKPKTKPRNMLAGSNRTGMGKRAFINYPESIYQKDPYKDPFKIELQHQRKVRGKSVLHENDFKPASRSRTLTNASYLHIEEKQPREGKKIQRDENGRVKTEPSNVLTNPISKIQDRLFEHVRHMRDEYSRPHDIQKQQKGIWREKIKSQTMFRSTSHGGNYFTKERAIFGLDKTSQDLMSKRKPFRFKYSQNRMTHEVRFKLARRGHGDPISRYPDFVSSRIKTQGNQLKNVKGQTQKDIWRPSTGDLTRPTPSISLMAKNLKRHL